MIKQQSRTANDRDNIIVALVKENDLLRLKAAELLLEIDGIAKLPTASSRRPQSVSVRRRANGA